MPKIPTVTVLMTVYNAQAYLKASMESVLSQSWQDFEFLIIDDGSRDDSVKIIESFSDPRIVLVRNAANVGQTKSLNIGLGLARGEFLARMDADDFAFLSWLEELLGFMRAQGKDCVLASPRAAVVSAGGQVHKVLNTPRTFTEIVVRSLWASPINHVGVLMRRQAVLDQGGYDLAFRIAADYALWSMFLRQGFKLAVFPRVLITIRCHGASVTAMEAGKGDVAEVSCIMAGNVRFWTGLDLSPEEAVLWWRLMCDAPSLDTARMGVASAIFGRVQKSFLGRRHQGLEKADQFFARQRRIIFVKRIFGRLGHRPVFNLAPALYTQYRRLRMK